MEYFNKLEGDNIYLSPIDVEDYKIYTKWLNDLSVAIPAGMSALMISLQNEKEFMKEKRRNNQDFAIVLKGDGENEDRLIGNCGLFCINNVHRNAELGIFIGEKDCKGKGYGPEAIKLLINYGFKILNIHNIMLNVFSFNERAVKAYKKVGFRECGRRSEAYRVNGQYYDVISMEMVDRDLDCTYLDDVLPK